MTITTHVLTSDTEKNWYSSDGQKLAKEKHTEKGNTVDTKCDSKLRDFCCDLNTFIDS